MAQVSACHTDLGDPGEREAGYYPPSGGPWQWARIRSNAGASGGNLRVLHSDNDPFIPLAEAETVAASLGVPLTLVPGRSHFFKPCEELVRAVYDVAFNDGTGAFAHGTGAAECPTAERGPGAAEGANASPLSRLAAA